MVTKQRTTANLPHMMIPHCGASSNPADNMNLPSSSVKRSAVAHKCVDIAPGLGMGGGYVLRLLN